MMGRLISKRWFSAALLCAVVLTAGVGVRRSAGAVDIEGRVVVASLTLPGLTGDANVLGLSTGAIDVPAAFVVTALPEFSESLAFGALDVVVDFQGPDLVTLGLDVVGPGQGALGGVELEMTVPGVTLRSASIVATASPRAFVEVEQTGDGVIRLVIPADELTVPGYQEITIRLSDLAGVPAFDLLGDTVSGNLDIGEAANEFDTLGGGGFLDTPAVVVDPGTEFSWDSGFGFGARCDVRSDRVALIWEFDSQPPSPVFDFDQTLRIGGIAAEVVGAVVTQNPFDSAAVSFTSDSIEVSIPAGSPVTGSQMTLVVRLDLAPVVVITEQPVGGLFEAGSDVALSVGVESSEASVGYQWTRNGLPLVDGGRVAGALSGALTISAAEAGDTDEYAVEVSGGGVTVVSSPALVSVRGGAGGDPIDLDGNGVVDVFDLIAFLQGLSAALNP